MVFFLTSEGCGKTLRLNLNSPARGIHPAFSLTAVSPDFHYHWVADAIINWLTSHVKDNKSSPPRGGTSTGTEGKADTHALVYTSLAVSKLLDDIDWSDVVHRQLLMVLLKSEGSSRTSRLEKGRIMLPTAVSLDHHHQFHQFNQVRCMLCACCVH